MYIISKKIDIFGISLSGVFIFFLLKMLNADSLIYFAIVIAISVALDNGHVYMTYSRIKKEFKTSPLFFVIVPIGIIATFTAWLYLQIPYFWSFVVYATFFHFARQIYGINRWYMSLIKQKSKVLDYTLYALLILPVISFTFNPFQHLELYTANDFLSYKSQLFFNITILINIVVICFWFLLEYNIYKAQKSTNWYRVLFIFSNALLFTLVGYFAQNYIEIIIPLMMAHGFQYLMLSSNFETKIHKKNMLKIFFVLLAIGIIFGGADTYLQTLFDMDNTYLHYKSFLDDFLLSILLAPLFSHYIYDMKIWKSAYIHSIITTDKNFYR